MCSPADTIIERNGHGRDEEAGGRVGNQAWLIWRVITNDVAFLMRLSATIMVKVISQRFA